MNKLKSFKKAIEDVKAGNEIALEASKKELTLIPEMPELGLLLTSFVIKFSASLTFLKSLTLSHNKISGLFFMQFIFQRNSGRNRDASVPRAS